MDLKIKHNKSNVILLCGSDVLATIDRDLLISLLTPPKIVKPKTSIENKTALVIKAYKIAWEKYYQTRLKTDYKKGTKDYASFVKAAGICIQHDAKARTFVEAQIEGLKFVNGSGIFPKPNQMCTPNAETRLLEYMKDGSIEDKPILTWEIDTPLEKNQRYQQIKLKIKDNTASLKEAKYALECEIKRTGQSSIGTRAYVKVMEEHAR